MRKTGISFIAKENSSFYSLNRRRSIHMYIKNFINDIQKSKNIKKHMLYNHSNFFYIFTEIEKKSGRKKTI